MQKRKQRVVARKTLGPGLHVGVVELMSNGAYRVALMTGGHVRADLDPGVSPAFVQRCMKAGRNVLLADGSRGPTMLGALQTDDEDASIEDSLRLRADKEIAFEVGSTRLLLTSDGKIRIEGRDLAMDVSSLVRFLSARVELP
jgi:hypothetical protein